MALTILNRTLQKRYMNIQNTYCLSILLKHNVWYSTKKSITNVESDETDNKKQVSTVEVGK